MNNKWVPATAVLFASMQYAAALHAGPCKEFDPPYKTIELVLDNGNLKDPGDTDVKESGGRRVLIVWKAPDGWVFKAGGITMKRPNNPARPQFGQGSPGIQPPPPGQPDHRESIYYHLCDQNTARGRFDYEITIWKGSVMQHIDPSLVNDGSGFIGARRPHKRVHKKLPA